MNLFMKEEHLQACMLYDTAMISFDESFYTPDQEELKKIGNECIRESLFALLDLSLLSIGRITLYFNPVHQDEDEVQSGAEKICAYIRSTSRQNEQKDISSLYEVVLTDAGKYPSRVINAVFVYSEHASSKELTERLRNLPAAAGEKLSLKKAEELLYAIQFAGGTAVIRNISLSDH